MKHLKNLLSFIGETVKIVILALVIVIPIRYFLFQPFIVKGQSMEPNFEENNYLIIDEISYRFKNPERGEVVVFKYPQNPSQRFIKRIIGLPGETVEIKNNRTRIFQANGTERVLNESAYLPVNLETQGDLRVVLGQGEYFVMGDNRASSYDSRRWGPLPRENIIGKVSLRLLPFTKMDNFKAPLYSQ